MSPRIFHGGLGEPRTPQPQQRTPAEINPNIDKEHRFWWILRFVASSHKCTLLPLVAAGRFGGCGRRAGRIRWRAAPEKRGYEREIHASMLQLVPAESVTGAREPEGEAWAVDSLDVEQAAREQAAASRNKRRRLIAEAEADAEGDDAGMLSTAALAPEHDDGPRRRRVSSATSADASHQVNATNARLSAAIRKKKRLAPASRTCLACTKGKHTAHTCGVRGKRLPDEDDNDKTSDSS